MNNSTYSKITILFFILSFFLISCQNDEKEKEAIIAVIEESTNAYKARDFERLSAVWIQDESIVRLNSGKYGYSYSNSWAEIGQAYKQLFEEHPDAITTKYEKTNFKIEIYKKSAWVVHDELIYDSENEYQYKQFGVHLLIKRKGEWKIVYLSYVDTSTYDESETT